MRNFIQDGRRINYANTSGSDIQPGTVIVVGTLTGIAESVIAAGDSGTLFLTGVFQLAKLAGTAYTQGEKLYWDATALNLTTVSSGNTAIGAAWLPALSADTIAQVVLQNNI